MTNDPLIVRSTHEPIESVCRHLPDIAQAHQFGVLGMHDLKQKMLSKGVSFDRECRVFEVCNPQQAQSVLNQAIEISTALPCRISVYEQDGRTILATIKPTALLEMFRAPEADAIAREVEISMIEIMDEVAGVTVT